jgi:hypothetical protein
MYYAPARPDGIRAIVENIEGNENGFRVAPVEGARPYLQNCPVYSEAKPCIGNSRDDCHDIQLFMYSRSCMIGS